MKIATGNLVKYQEAVELYDYNRDFKSGIVLATKDFKEYDYRKAYILWDSGEITKEHCYRLKIINENIEID